MSMLDAACTSWTEDLANGGDQVRPGARLQRKQKRRTFAGSGAAAPKKRAVKSAALEQRVRPKHALAMALCA